MIESVFGFVVGVIVTLVIEIILIIFFRKWIMMKIFAYYSKKMLGMFK